MTIEISEKRRVVMPWMRKRPRKPKEAEQIAGPVSDQVAQQSAPSNPVLESTVTEPEEIATSIKMMAQQEAEAEAERIISQAKQEIQKIKSRAKIAAQKEVEAEVERIISQAKQDAEEIVRGAEVKAKKEAEGKAEKIINQTKQEAEDKAERIISQAKQEAEDKAERIISQAKQEAEDKAERIISQAKQEAEAKAEGIISQAKQDAETKAEKVEEPVQLKKTETKAEKVEEPVQLKHDSQTLYAGEVELTIDKPVNPKVASKLYTYFQTTPEIKLVHTSGSWDRGITITVILDKPIPLISAISPKIPEAEVKPERPETDGFVKGKKGVRRIRLASKEA